MIYQLARGTPIFLEDPLSPREPYIVEKVLREGEAYTLATFLTRAAALKCLNSIRASEEVRRGATITEAL